MLVEYEVIAVFLNCVVRQMHEEVVQIVVLWAHILFSRKTSKALLVHKNSERVDTVDECVYSKVEL